MSRSDISCIIIAKNEADVIRTCVQAALRACQEVIVVDTGSTDSTVQIAQESGARVISTSWEGFGPTKNKATEFASNDWILSLDADEVPDDALITTINQLELKHNSIYILNRLSYVMNQAVKHSGWYPDLIPRLYHTSKASWTRDHVHERLAYDSSASCIQLSGVLHHYSYSSMEDYKAKVLSYAMLKAQIWLDRNNPPNAAMRIFRPIFLFVKSYILRFGFLDGKVGLLIAQMNYLLGKEQIRAYDRLKSLEK